MSERQGIVGWFTSIFSPPEPAPPPPPPPPPSPFNRYDDLILEACQKYRIPFYLLKNLIKQESRFDPRAQSPGVGAQGLTQLMPATQEMMGVTDPFDPRQSIMGGARYLRSLYDVFKREIGVDRWRYALGAYNAGMGYILAAQKEARRRKLDNTDWAVISVLLYVAKHRGRKADWAQVCVYVQNIVDGWFNDAMKEISGGKTRSLTEA